MIVIDRDTVKSNLGLDEATYDAQIDMQIPIIDAKVKQICQNNFNTQLTMDMTAGDQYIEIWAVYYYWGGRLCKRSRSDPQMREIVKDIPVGTYIEGDGLARTWITEVYYDYSAEFNGTTYSAPFIKVETAPTSSDSSAQGFYGWNKAFDSVVSKGIWYNIQQTSTSIDDGSWQTKKYGPVLVSKGSDEMRMDLKSGMPLWFVKSLPRYM